MKMFSDCSGECAVCGCAGSCLAGHGDDDFYPATKKQLIERLDQGEYHKDRQLMIDTLKAQFDFIYEIDVTDKHSGIINNPIKRVMLDGEIYHIKPFDSERCVIWKVTKIIKRDNTQKGDENK